MSSIFCQAGGISIRSALGKSTPPVTSTSSILSRLDESDPDSLTKGVTLCKSGSSLDRSLGVRALDQFRFPSIVLISPLWASILNGCANGHFGSVFVENR